EPLTCGLATGVRGVPAFDRSPRNCAHAIARCRNSGGHYRGPAVIFAGDVLPGGTRVALVVVQLSPIRVLQIRGEP
ncbi:MAG: hypothetical protein ABJD68_10810, partial [Nakamurella sp.]